MTVYIYGLYDPRNGLLRYIGKAINPKQRLDLHVSESRHGRNTHKNQWVRKLISIGVIPEMRVLETIENSDDKDWQDRERWWIKAARNSGDPITNLDDGGRFGTQKSQETKDKIRAKAVGRKMSADAVDKMKATKAERLTPEVRNRMRLSQLGKRRTPEQKAAHSIALTGRTVSEETRRKIGESNKIALKAYYASLPPKLPKPPKEKYIVSDKTKAKQRAAKLGRKMSPEAYAKCLALAESKKGVSRSPEVRAKMSQAKREGWARKKALQNQTEEAIKSV